MGNRVPHGPPGRHRRGARHPPSPRARGRRVTRVTAQQQRQIATAIKDAREMALLPYSGKRD
ncbi:hypothetical protein Sm713_07800 [Streptomyces sp. TS71-3]|nr:hypothetical protein Sm713_07800 [Streptomyces sp. TS71-3]